MDQRDRDFLKNRASSTRVVSKEQELSQVLHEKDSSQSKAQLVIIIDELMESIQSQEKNSTAKKHLQGIIGDE